MDDETIPEWSIEGADMNVLGRVWVEYILTNGLDHLVQKNADGSKTLYLLTPEGPRQTTIQAEKNTHDG